MTHEGSYVPALGNRSRWNRLAGELLADNSVVSSLCLCQEDADDGSPAVSGQRSRARAGAPTGEPTGWYAEDAAVRQGGPTGASLEGPGVAQGGITRQGCNLLSLHGFILLCVAVRATGRP